MNLAATLLISLYLLTLVGSAQDPTVPVPELETLKKEYAALVATTDAPYLAAVAELEKKYGARLEQEQKTAQQAGALAMAIAYEKKAILSGRGVPTEDYAKIPVTLRNMHATYRVEIAKLEPLRARNHKLLFKDYVVELDALAARLTKEGKLREATSVKSYRANLPANPVAAAVATVADVAAGAFRNRTAGEVMSIRLPDGTVMKFCCCPPGGFLMGSPPAEPSRCGNENQVNVKLSKGFWLAQTECTQKQWVAVMDSNPSNFKGDDLPVEKVSWNDAQKFITNLNEGKTLPAGWKAALPTEAQWEYACRAGTKTAYSFGDALDAKQANINNSLGKTSAVASYPANAWGLYDMHGNVEEWCEDRYGDKLPGGTDPTMAGGNTGSYRVLRGGHWCRDVTFCRVAGRGVCPPGYSCYSIGFRVALNSVP